MSKAGWAREASSDSVHVRARMNCSVDDGRLLTFVPDLLMADECATHATAGKSSNHSGPKVRAPDPNGSTDPPHHLRSLPDDPSPAIPAGSGQ
jgi:hypothetical protein